MTLTSGALFGPYSLLERAGAIGPAEIWRAFRVDSRRLTAIHLLPRALPAEPGFADRFQREAQAIVRLNHPSILRVTDYGEREGLTYFVTPFVGGLTLDYLLGQRWSAAEALLVLRPLAAALDHVHARGLVHRELRPTNVVVSDDVRVYLGPFGIGPLLEPEPPAGPLPSPVSARPSKYVAPEVLRGEPATAASDRYTLGVIAFELLTGRLPFTAEVWPPELQPPAGGPSPAPCTLSPALSSRVAVVLFTALAEAADDRYPSATELARALAAADRPIVAVAEPASRPNPTGDEPTAPPPPTSPAERLGRTPILDPVFRPPRRLPHRRLVGALAALALVLIAVNLLVIQPSLGTLAGRGDHVAVPLSGGEVLVAGGCANVPASGTVASAVRAVRTFGGRGRGPGWLNAAVLYAADERGWSQTERLLEPRCGARALALPDGRALIVGGSGANGQVLATAERYERSISSWTAAGRLTIARRELAVVALANGQALVIGGTNAGGRGEPLASSERYDLIGNRWSLIGGLAEARAAHTASLLPDGQVLVAGGVGLSGGALVSAERWNPTRGAWSPVGPLLQARSAHSATVLADGRVLVAGGSAERSRLASAERYDPSTDTWTRLASLSQARSGHTATLLPDGQVLVVGGSGPSGVLASAERYDPATNVWALAGSLAQARAGHTATLLPSGRVLIVGGTQGSPDEPYLHTVELYDPLTNRWTFAPDLPSDPSLDLVLPGGGRRR